MEETWLYERPFLEVVNVIEDKLKDNYYMKVK